MGANVQGFPLYPCALLATQVSQKFWYSGFQDSKSKSDQEVKIEENIGAMESFFWECISFLRTTFTNLRNLERDMKSLREETDKLSAQEEDVMTEVEREEVEKGKKRKREVDVWLENVKRFKKEVDGAEENVREKRGWISRYKLTKHIEDLKAEVVQLKEKNGFSDGVAIHQLGIPSPQPAATLQSESANTTMRRIWNHLLDVEIRKVGVYGMGGVGKTTILKHIHNQLLHSGVFKSIFWVTVSKALDLYRLQEEIAGAIGLDTIELHDLIRDLAIKITRVSPRFMVKAREDLEETPRVEEWVENMKRVSLMDSKIKILSGQPMCPQLTTLFLQGNSRLTEISNSFFENMQGLRVVDLSYTMINSLPESFFALKNLRVLRLDCCENLHKVPCLATLKHLRVLSLDHTLIQELPQGIEELVNLRKLRLNGTSRLELFPAGIIPKLTLLEELEMLGSGWRWPSNTVRAAADIKEIVESTKITRLGLHFEDVNGFNNLVGSGKVLALKSFDIALGKNLPIWGFGGSKKVAVESTGVAGGSHASDFLLPRNVQEMTIREVHDVTSLSQFSQPPNEEWANDLEALCLLSLPNLRAIFDSDGSIEAYVHLKRLEVGHCSRMKSLFSLGQLKNLQNLEHLEIWDCALMEDVVADDRNALTTISLPKLRYIDIAWLPELKSIFKTTVTCYSLYSIEVFQCPKLKKLPFTTRNISLPTLERICGNREWWDALEWDDPDVKTQLQDRFTDQISPVQAIRQIRIYSFLAHSLVYDFVS
ncbi:hypothetical protein MRB53_013120 [Persea americana]|uniref:Uncharacterized protein n=1 Tax=Persea americana TaxID=3435 RepID=A0ACC2K7K7_PERAE|nr:hypothetical protein MRB53_013120 [Persea americana]